MKDSKHEEEDALSASLSPLFKDRKSRYVVWPSGYVLDRRLFLWYCIILGVLAVVIWGSSVLRGTDNYAYVHCPEDSIGGFCENPLYNKCDMEACRYQMIPAGAEYGTKPTIINQFIYITLVPLAILFLFNHFMQQGRRYEDVRNTHRKHDTKRRKSD